MPAKILLVTGTDTGVGKTIVTAGLTMALNASGIATVAVKPVETGCGLVTNENEDGVLLWEASGKQGWYGAMYRLPEPLAPAVAADRAGVKVDTNHIIERLYDLMDQYHYLIIEGAGGLLVPLTWEMNYLDLAAILHAQVLIIGRTGLGTINHTLLTYQTLKRAGIKILGVVLNNSTGQYDSSIETNPEAIARLSECSNIITLPYWSSISPSSIAQLSQPHLSQVACWITAS